MPANLPWTRNRPDKLRYRFQVVSEENPELFEFLWRELGARSDNHVIVAMLEAGRRALLSPPDAAAAREGAEPRAGNSRMARKSLETARAAGQGVPAPSPRQTAGRGGDATQHAAPEVPAGETAREPEVAAERQGSEQSDRAMVGSVAALTTSSQADTGTATPAADAQRPSGTGLDVGQGSGGNLDDGSGSWGDDLEGGLGKSATDLVNQFF